MRRISEVRDRERLDFLEKSLIRKGYSSITITIDYMRL